jgi:hypothetical protein
MQYILLLHVNEASWPKLTKAEQEQGMAAYMAYAEALNKAGVLRGSNRLQPRTHLPRSREPFTNNLLDNSSQAEEGEKVCAN